MIVCLEMKKKQVMILSKTLNFILVSNDYEKLVTYNFLIDLLVILNITYNTEKSVSRSLLHVR